MKEQLTHIHSLALNRSMSEGIDARESGAQNRPKNMGSEKRSRQNLTPDALREMWYKGRDPEKIPLDERRTIQELIAMGVPPIGGGADENETGRIRVNAEGRELLRLANAGQIDISNGLNRDYMRVLQENGIDVPNGTITPQQAEEYIRELVEKDRLERESASQNESGEVDDLAWLNEFMDIDPEISQAITTFRTSGGGTPESIGSLIKQLSQIAEAKGLFASVPYRNLLNRLSGVQMKSGEGRREGQYDPPKSLEDLIEYNMRSVPPEYRLGGEKELLSVTPRGEKRVNFENFIRYIHDLGNQREEVNPRAPVDYFSVFQMKYNYNNYGLDQVLLYKETGTLFLPHREDGESEAHYEARQKVYSQVRNQLANDLWGRSVARRNHSELEYQSGALGSDSDYPKIILKLYQDNVFTTSTNLQDQFNISTSLSYSPDMIEKRIDALTEDINANIDRFDDNIVGQEFRRAMSVYAHMNDYESLTRILGTWEKDGNGKNVRYIEGSAEANSPFFSKELAEDMLKRLGPGRQEERAILRRALKEEWYENGKLNPNKILPNGKSVKSEFVTLINIFNDANKPLPVIEAIQEKLVASLALNAYNKLKAGREMPVDGLAPNKQPWTQETWDEELWKHAMESAKYAHANAYNWTSFTGINTGDNDPRAQAFRAKSKPDNVWAYFNKQIDPDRGQFPGNTYLMAGVTRMSTTMNNMIKTIDGRTITDVAEGREKDEATDKFDFDSRVGKLEFYREAMSQLAQNHTNRVFGLFHDITEAKELGIGAFVSRDPNPLAGGRLIIDKAKAQEIFEKWKNWRYIFNSIPFEHRIRAMVGQDNEGNYIYKEMTIAEAFFSKELLDQYIHHGREKLVDNIVIKNGDVDPEKLTNRSKYGTDNLWKGFMKYFIAAELYSHQKHESGSNKYSYNDIQQIMGFLKKLPAKALYGETQEDFTKREMHKTKIENYFLNDSDINWMLKKAKSEWWRVGGAEFAYNGAMGTIEGGWKFFKTLFLDGMFK